MPRFEVVPDRSRLWIDARSTVHPIHVEATELEGVLDIDLDTEGHPDVGGECSGSLEVAVDELRSGIAIVDRETERRLDARRHPRIVAELARLDVTGQQGRYHAVGSLALHGQTRRITGELDIAVEPDGALLVTGERGFDVRDWGLAPPKLLLLKVHPDVAVRVEIRAERADRARP